MSLIKDVKTILERQNIAENIYLSYMPNSPDNIVSIFSTGGFQRSNSGNKLEEPTFQVRVRSNEYETGYKLIEDIKDFIHDLQEEVVGVVRYLSFYQIGDITDLGRDSNNRIGFVINFRAYVHRNFDTSTLDIEEAKRLVILAEREKRQKEVNEAIVAIDKVIDIEIKQELLNRIQVVQEYVDYQENIVNQLNSEIDILNQEIIVLKEQLGNGGGDCSGLLIQIEQLQLEISNKEAIINQLNSTIIERDNSITELTLQNNTKAIRITELEEDNSLKSSQIIQLEDNVRILNLSISNKDDEINSLTLTISNQKNEIEQLNISITSKNIQIEELESTIDTKVLLITNLQLEVSNKETTIIQLQSTITDLEEQLANSDGGACVRNRILVDFGTEEFKTLEGNWNNLTDYISGSIQNLISENAESTGVGINVHLPFNGTGIEGMDLYGDFYFKDTVRDYFSLNAYQTAGFKISGLKPNKYYRITIFGSINRSSYSSRYYVEADFELNRTNHKPIEINVAQNISNTVAKTLKPSVDGDLYIYLYGLGVINALEIEEL